MHGVSKADLLSGNFTNPSVVTYNNWAPYPGFTIVPSATQVRTGPTPSPPKLHLVLCSAHIFTVHLVYKDWGMAWCLPMKCVILK